MDLKEFNNLLISLTSQDEFSGAVLILKNSKKLLSYASGYADKEKEIKNSIQTLFNIGSIDKMFTAVAIAQLVQKNKLAFEDKISIYLPDLPLHLREVTVHQILTHTAGFASYFNKKYIEKRTEIHTVQDYLDLFIELPLLFKPGEKYQYSNSGYVLLGAIIEAITQSSYYDFIQTNICRPADMRSTGSFHPLTKSANFAKGYTLRLPFSQDIGTGPRRENTGELPPLGSPAGGGYSTCKDLIKFFQALDSFQLVNEQLTKHIMSPKVTIETKNGQTLYYGYGFQIIDLGDGQLRYGHAGAFAGVNARADMYKSKNNIVIVLSNYDVPAAFRVANYAEKLILSL